ncbi:13051_t:CDS:2, partial [Racocetra fulgida]
LHTDPYFLESSDPTSFCHRYSPNPVLNIAGKFGILSAPCDSPYPLTNSTFEFMRTNFSDIDFIVYTGDSVRHDKDKAFKRTQEQVLDTHRTVVEYVRKYFDISRIKFVISVSSSSSCNGSLLKSSLCIEHNRLSQGPNDLLGNLSQIWAPLNLNLTSDFIKGGYFRQDIHSKISVLSLNSMYFYKKNTIVPDCNVTDGPGALQLEWFERELKSARHEGRKIYISQHVPPLDDSNTLSFVTSASKDEDAYSIFVLNETHVSNISSVDDVVLVLTNAPSIKPIESSINISTAIYINSGTVKLDSSSESSCMSLTVLQQSYFVNLTEANGIGEAIWRIEYVASETYGMNSLETKEWTRVLNKFRVPD